MAVMAVIGAVSSCVTKRFVVSPKDGWDEPINVYAVIALPPGNSKSLVKRECVSPIDDWEMWKRVEMDSEIQQAKSRRRNREWGWMRFSQDGGEGTRRDQAKATVPQK